MNKVLLSLLAWQKENVKRKIQDSIFFIITEKAEYAAVKPCHLSSFLTKETA